MKKVFIFLTITLISLIGVLVMSSCSTSNDGDDGRSFNCELVAFQDSRSYQAHGSISGFIFVTGYFNARNEMVYQVMIKTDEGIHYLELKANRTTIVFSDNPRVDIRCVGTANSLGNPHYSLHNRIIHYNKSMDGTAQCMSLYENTLYVPEGSIMFDNKIDGK